jgi:hypothetical protein
MTPENGRKWPQRQGFLERIRRKYNEIEMERPHLCAKNCRILLLTAIGLCCVKFEHPKQAGNGMGYVSWRGSGEQTLKFN